MEEKKLSFVAYLKNFLSWEDYENLHIYLKESRKYSTMIENNPSIGTMQHLLVLVRLLKKNDSEATPIKLIKEFGFGKNNISSEERKLLKQTQLA